MPPITGRTRVFALIGHPIGHSPSPALHNAWFDAAGLDAVYVALPTPAPLPDLAGTLRALGVAGANLTLPHKVAALAGCDDVDATARACGAINVLVPTATGAIGRNTDAPGFLLALAEAGRSAAGARCAVLGSGGAARAVVAGLAEAGAAEVTVLARNADAAATVARLAGPRGRGAALDPTTFLALAPTLDLVVHALPGAARAAVAALPARALPRSCAWFDLNYWEDGDPWRAALAAEGRPVIDGAGMLLHQAALAFALFTGHPPDLDVGRAALTRALGR